MMKTKLIALLSLTIFLFSFGMKTDVLIVKSSMQCGECEDIIRNGLIYEKGIKRIETNVKMNTILVYYNSSKITPERIRLLITQLGYDADEMKADPKAFQALPACCKKPHGEHLE